MRSARGCASLLLLLLLLLLPPLPAPGSASTSGEALGVEAFTTLVSPSLPMATQDTRLRPSQPP